MEKKVLVLAPHPDDAEFSAGGLIAKFVHEGMTVTILTATDGCCGSYNHTREELIAIRTSEAGKAAAVLGARVEFLGYYDYELDNLPAGELREKIVRCIRLYQPDIAVSIDPFARNEPHPDHRALAWAASDAINHSGLPLVYPHQVEQGLAPHYIGEKYYYSEDTSIQNKVVDISPYFENKMAALKAHASQVTFLVEDFLRQAKIAGLNPTDIPGLAEDDPFSALTYAMSLQARQTGTLIGVDYAESFRYTRFHPFIEAILAQQ